MLFEITITPGSAVSRVAIISREINFNSETRQKYYTTSSLALTGINTNDNDEDACVADELIDYRNL